MKNQLLQNLFLFLLMSSIIVSYSCSSVNQTEKISRLTDSNCYGGFLRSIEKRAIPIALDSLDLSERLKANFSQRTLNIAHAMGLLETMDEYFKLLEVYKENPTLGNKVNFLDKYQRLSQKLEASKMEISSVQSELVCEEERIDQVAQYLKSKENTQIKNLTVGYILLGAVSAVLSAFVLSDVADNYFGFGVGIIGAGIGYSILKVNKSIDFIHPRNHLKEMMFGTETSELFPLSVWYYLNYVDTEMDSPSSSRSEVLHIWRTLGLFAEIKPKDMPQMQEKFFGESGRYSSYELTLRAGMYEQISAQINLMMQDLNFLIREFGKTQSEFRE